jgi:molybdate transport system substrate-binding protein
MKRSSSLRRAGFFAMGGLLSGVPAPNLAVQAPATLTVFAAASLTDAMVTLGRAFESSHPGTKVQFNFAGSQQLALQLQQGAKADVFASADERWMQAVRDSGLIAGEPVVFARNRLVVVLPKTNPAGIQQLQNLARAGLKIVIGAEAVPVGKYTRQMLEQLSAQPGFGRDFGARVLANVASYEENVKGVVAKVQLGEADAGVVYRSDATGPSAVQLATVDIPDAANVIATYPIAVTTVSANPTLAAAFVGLVESAEGQAALQRAGFMAVGSPAGAPAP